MDSSRFQSPERPVFKAETADDLRDLITQAELIVANLRGAGPRAQTLLFLMDVIKGLWASLQETGVDLRAEAARVETVERLLLSKDGILVRQMRRLGGLAKAREVVKPVPAQWWWYLDGRVAEGHQRQLRSWLLIAAAATAVFLIASLLYTYVFPPDPKRLAAMDKARQAEEALAEGDLPGALAYYRQAAEFTPDDPEAQVWVGLLEEKLGHDTAAAEAYAIGEQLVGDRARFLTLRGMAHFRMGSADQAEADAQASLAANPDLAEGHLLLGSVYEAQGDTVRAIAAFEKTAELAERENNSALIVLAKTRLGMLLQSAPMRLPADATATPSAS